MATRQYDAMRTHRDYVVDSPDCDGELEVETNGADELWFTKQDLLDMLELFDRFPTGEANAKGD